MMLYQGTHITNKCMNTRNMISFSTYNIPNASRASERQKIQQCHILIDIHSSLDRSIMPQFPNLVIPSAFLHFPSFFLLGSVIFSIPRDVLHLYTWRMSRSSSFDVFQYN